MCSIGDPQHFQKIDSSKISNCLLKIFIYFFFVFYQLGLRCFKWLLRSFRVIQDQNCYSFTNRGGKYLQKYLNPLSQMFPAVLYYAAHIHLFKVNNGNSRTICEICSKLTIRTLERRHGHCPGVFIVTFEHISQL